MCKKTFRNLTVFIAIVPALFGAIACSGKSSDGIDEITLAYYVNSATPSDLQLIEDAINEITEEEISVRVDLLPISLGTYKEQINLMLSSGEELDLFMMSGSTFAGYVANGQAIALDDYLAEYGKGIVDAIGEELLQGGRVNGKIYGVAPIRDIAQGAGVFIRKDYVDKYGIDMDAIHSLEDVEATLAKIKAAEPDFYPLVIEKNDTLTPVELLAGKDNISDGFGVIMNDGDPFEVVNWYASERYAEMVSTMRRWYESGYISPDVATNTEAIATQMTAEVGACYFYMTKVGIEGQQSKANNCEMVCAEILAPFISTAKVQLLQWGVAVNSNEPEAAVKFLNMMYTDERIVNLIDWGVEGMHYVFTEDGHIRYPDGMTAANSGYNLNMSWAFGSQFISYVWEGDDLDIWEQALERKASTPISETMGFTFDSSNVLSEIAALNNVASEYRIGLETGAMSAQRLQEFLDKLEEAGVDKVVAEKQKQLDEWVGAN